MCCQLYIVYRYLWKLEYKVFWAWFRPFSAPFVDRKAQIKPDSAFASPAPFNDLSQLSGRWNRSGRRCTCCAWNCGPSACALRFLRPRRGIIRGVYPPGIQILLKVIVVGIQSSLSLKKSERKSIRCYYPRKKNHSLIHCVPLTTVFLQERDTRSKNIRFSKFFHRIIINALTFVSKG